MGQLLRVAALTLVVAVVSAGSAAAKPPGTAYSVTDLGTLGGTTSNAYGVNDSGAVVGSSTIAGDGASHAFLYDSQGLHDLGTLTGGASSVAYAINRYGQIAGTSDRLVADWPSCAVYGCVPRMTSRAFRYAAGTMVDLGGNPLSTSYFDPLLSVGRGINDHGDVAGMYLNFSRDPVPAYWVGSSLVSLTGRQGGEAFGINDSDEVVGDYAYGGQFLARNGVATDLPTAFGPPSFGGWPSINDDGHVAYSGRGSSGGPIDALLYSNGVVSDIGSFTPYGISQNDQVVGSADVSGGSTHAVLWRADKLRDLNDAIASSSGWVLESARGVNKWGQIVGTGTIGGEEHAFLLTPLRKD
jgi:probable HAF family extracellular repeat protein